MRAHPRVGGENGTCSGSRPGVPGSSPRGRGKHALAVARLDSAGLIPAWAGKTRPGRRPPGLSRAHPRVGGENVIGTFVAGFKTGSSPRGRGKREGARLRPGSRRLIPAWAGKTARPRPPTSQARAHPRVGGENLIGVAADLSAQGSSPRGRGKHDDLADAGGALRLIPAWAGKTMADRSATSSQPGSSPRGRGKRRRRGLPRHGRRLIPAWAGKT